jgi:predicted RNA-binding Zn-ribbon protein involved in translation (DUF1610 family)
MVVLLCSSLFIATETNPPLFMSQTVPRCRACKKRVHPLRYRTLFDCWYCPRCETARIRIIVSQLITELTV